MFGGNQFWWVGLMMMAIFISMNIIVFALRNHPRISYRVAYFIAFYLLLNKVAEYIAYQALGEHLRLPVEFSALSYFAFAIFVVFRFGKADSFPAFCAVLTGLIFTISFWVSPDSFILDMDHPFLFINSVLNHHLVYLGGMLMLANARKYSWKQCWQPVLGVGIFVGYSWLFHSLSAYSSIYGKPIIIQICDASILAWLFKDMQISPGVYVAYYLLVVALLVGLFVGFYALNRWGVRYRSRRGIDEDGYCLHWKEVFCAKKSQKIEEK
ncbi:MAG: hypothetical protein IJX70_02500 [Clostridia bacterium]|nr:hypothetical protein [Clostridia bacterium]